MNPAEWQEDAPLFSVLIPCYNVQKYVEECIESVVAQSFGSWEIIAINDGSTDSTGAILDSLGERLGSRMTVVHTENRGLLLARREAFRRAVGRYLICLDSDDGLRQDALELLADAIRAHPGSLIQFRFSRSSDFGGPAYPEYPQGKTERQLDVSWLRRQVCSSSSYNNLSGKAIPCECVDSERDYSCYQYMRNAEDLLQLIEVLNRAHSVVLIEDVLYFYRVNSASITQTFQPRFFDSVRTANAALWKSARQWGDSGLENLLAVRWLRAVLTAMLELSKSGYSLKTLVAELHRYADDSLTRKSWALASGIEGSEMSVPLGLLMKGRYRLLALAILLMGKVRR